MLAALRSLSWLRRAHRVPETNQQWPDDSERLDEFGRRADAVFERRVKPNLGPADEGKFVALDVSTGNYEIDADELTAEDRLLELNPSAAVWLTRVGSRAAHRLGGVIEVA